jgi:hypothetical protein
VQSTTGNEKCVFILNIMGKCMHTLASIHIRTYTYSAHAQCQLNILSSGFVGGVGIGFGDGVSMSPSGVSPTIELHRSPEQQHTKSSAVPIL